MGEKKAKKNSAQKNKKEGSGVKTRHFFCGLETPQMHNITPLAPKKLAPNNDVPYCGTVLPMTWVGNFSPLAFSDG